MQVTVDGDNVDDYPYVLLEIPELGGNFQATNLASTRAFAMLRFSDHLGSYREYKATEKETFRTDFRMLRLLDRLTFRFFTPTGAPYDFGTGVLLRTRYARVTTTTTEPAATPRLIVSISPSPSTTQSQLDEVMFSPAFGSVHLPAMAARSAVEKFTELWPW